MKRVLIPLMSLALSLGFAPRASAGLLAYEPFANAAGTTIIGSSDGFGFSSAWVNYSTSTGIDTNTSYGLSYTDGSGNSLTTSGGAGFFQGSTTANASMQPIRVLSFATGTNSGSIKTDGSSIWISFLIARSGPTGTLAGNPYGRGVNLGLDVSNGVTTAVVQHLATGGSSAAPQNTVGLIPQGAAGNLKPSTVTFGGQTNLVVVRIDYLNGNDSAYLWVNPTLGSQPLDSTANTNSLVGFDFSFNDIRMFAGGQANGAQPYGEALLDEVRIGDTWADVTPIPEPVMASLVGLGGLALLIYRRRK
jgi:hypothetical protein